MSAAVQAAKGKGPPPLILDAHWQCLRRSALPLTGGYLDQPYRLIHQMELLSDVYESVSAWSKGKPQPYHKKMVSYLAKLGLMGNG